MSAIDGHVPTVLVVQNDADSGPGRLPAWITAAGGRVHLVAAHDGVAVSTDPAETGADAVVLLGGGLMPDTDLDHPFLPAERELVRACVRQRVPLLGICLGGQLMAYALGGEVRENHGTPERGVVALSLRPSTRQDPLFARLFDEVPVVQNHADAITALPDGATWLAATSACPYQAFRVGDRAWGVQFHPEADADRVASWDRSRLRARGLDPDVMAAQARRHALAMEQAWSAFVGRFVALAAQRVDEQQEAV